MENPAKALEELFKPPEQPVEAPIMAAKKGRKPKSDLSLKDQVLALFRKDPDKEWGVAGVLERVKVGQPKLSDNSLRATITQLQKDGYLVTVRKEGRSIILKMSATPPEPEAATGEGKGKGRGRAAYNVRNAVVDDLEILREASVVITKLEALVKRNQGILLQIRKFRDSL